MLNFSSQIVDTDNGWASVQNQQLIIHDPAVGGQPARLSVDSHTQPFTVLIDDLPLVGSATVTTRTLISIQFPPDQAPIYDSEFKLSPDRCQLDLRIQVKQAAQHFSLADHPPSPHLTLSLTSEVLPLSDFEQSLAQDILLALQNSGIRKGVVPEGIRQAIRQPGEWVRVAETPAPVPAENRLDFLFELPRPEPENAAGFRIHWPVLAECLANEIILQRFFRPPGRPGYTVYGDLLKSETIPEPPLSAADQSVEISEFGEVFARIAGLPVFNGEQIHVSPHQSFTQLNSQKGLIHDLKHGLSIGGDLDEQTRLWSTGFVEIKGSVKQAEIHCNESLIIHGTCIGSQLTSGGDSAARLRLLEPVSHLKQEMEALLLMYQDLESRVSFRQLPSSKELFLRLIKTQFPGLLQAVDDLWQLNQSLKQLHPRRSLLLKVVLSHLMNLSDRPLDIRIFRDWLDKLSAFLVDLKPAVQAGGDIYLDYAQKTNAVAKGSIFVLGEGCYNSRLQAGGDILFCGTPGYCREGLLEARGRIVVRELGSPNGSRLKIVLPASGKLEAGFIYPGVEVCFGTAPVQHFVEACQQVSVCWKDDQMRVSESLLFKSEPKTDVLIEKI